MTLRIQVYLSLLSILAYCIVLRTHNLDIEQGIQWTDSKHKVQPYSALIGLLEM